MIIAGLAISLSIILKYFTYKAPILLRVGISGIFMLSPWWGVTSAFLFGLFGFEISDVAYFLVMFLPAIVGSVLWITIFSELVYPVKKKKLILIFTVFYVIYGLIIIFSAVINVNGLLGYRTSYLNATYQPIAIFLLILNMSVLFITYSLFIKESLSADAQEIRAKGYFAFLGMTLYATGAMIDLLIPTDIFSLIGRILLTLNTLSFYFCFAMPDWLKRRLAQEK